MVATESWTELHDATLESLDLHWSSGEALVRIRTDDTARPQRILVATAVRRLVYDRQMPWGFTVSINEIRGPTAMGEDFVLEIEMQSGDLIRIEAAMFYLR